MVIMACETRRCRGCCASGPVCHVVPRCRLGRCRRSGGRPLRHVGVRRYYDPQTGQFLSVDPDSQETRQAYAYVGNNPVNSVDPTGAWTMGFCAVGSISLIGYIGVDGCLVELMNGTTATKQFAVTLTGYFGFGGIAGASVGVYYQTTTATSWSQLAGWFQNVSYTADLGLGVNGSVFWTYGLSRSHVVGTTFGVSIGFGAGAEVGLSDTTVAPLNGFARNVAYLYLYGKYGNLGLVYKQVAEHAQLAKAVKYAEMTKR